MRPRQIAAGTVRRNDVITALNRDGEVIEQARLTKLLAFRGLERVPVEEASAGDIVAVAGLAQATVGDTLGAAGTSHALESQPSFTPQGSPVGLGPEEVAYGREWSK